MLYIIPLQVRAFYASQATQVLGQDIVFENIPWYNIEQQTFVRSLTPFISNSIIPSAFSNEHLITLEKGLHLHWHIPKPLKLFSQDTNLPKVPTRWYVSKKQNGVIKDEWIIESDYLWDINNPALKTSRHSTYPIPESGDVKEGFEFRYIGRTLKLNAWLNEQINNESNDYLGELTALGWGTLNFDLHYANCRSVFGFHDPDYQINQPCTYEITGFYANHEQDFLQTLIRNNRNELIQRISKLDLDKLENDEVIRQGVIDNEQSTNQQIDTFDISNIAKSFSPKFNTAKINKYKDRLSKSVRVHSTMTLLDRIQKINEISNNLSLEVLEVEINKSYIYDVEHAYKYFLDQNNFFADEYNRNYSYNSTVAGCPITQTEITDIHASSDQNIHTILAAKLSLNTEDFVCQI